MFCFCVVYFVVYLVPCKCVCGLILILTCFIFSFLVTNTECEMCAYVCMYVCMSIYLYIYLSQLLRVYPFLLTKKNRGRPATGYAYSLTIQLLLSSKHTGICSTSCRIMYADCCVLVAARFVQVQRLRAC